MTDYSYTFQVRWSSELEKWGVLERGLAGQYRLIAEHSRKESAKDHALKLARRYKTDVAFYTKDAGDSDRVTYKKDFS